MKLLRDSERQNPLARVAIAHPWLTGLVSGLVLACFGIVIGVNVWLSFAGGGVLVLVTWFLWRRGGPARKREERLFPPTRSPNDEV